MEGQFGLVSAIAWLLWKQTVRCVLSIRGSEGSTHVKGRDWKQDWAEEEAELQRRPNKLSANLVESSKQMLPARMSRMEANWLHSWCRFDGN